MPYNYLGDLYKSEIVVRLQDMGYNVRNVHELNLILEEMGIQEHYGNQWITTDKGVGYTIWRGRVANAEGWHPYIVDDIIDYLKRCK